MGCKLFSCLLFVLLSGSAIHAQVPQTMSYQGVLTDASGTAVPDGSYDITFRLYDDPVGGILLWSETAPVQVSKGIFSAVLGLINPMSIAFDQPYWLAIAIEGGAELIPLTRLTSSPYSLNARSVADGAVTSASIASGQVVKSINTLRDNVTLAAGSNVTITPSGNTLTIGATGDGNGDITAVTAGAGLAGGGASGDVSLSVAVPLNLTSSSVAGTIWGLNMDIGPGVIGQNNIGGTHGFLGSNSIGVYGTAGSTGRAVAGMHYDNNFGELAAQDFGAYGEHNSGNYGYLGTSNYGAYGQSVSDYGVRGISTDSYGMYATSTNSTAMRAIKTGGGDWAGRFSGNVDVAGTLSKGGGSFKIDHPLDPENKYLYHSFVESPDMMNIYNGNIALDGNGEAWVELPAWFEPLNDNFRYQLTPIGAPGPNLHIAERVANNRFKIAGGTSGMEVSWQITGIRRDPFANAHRIAVEVDKPAQERGKYLYAKEYGMPETRGIDYEEIRKMEEEISTMKERHRIEGERRKAENERMLQRGAQPR